MAKNSDGFKTLTAQPKSNEIAKSFTPKVGGSVRPSAPTSEAAPKTPPPPAKTG
jgi:hypothetical protein